MTDFSELPPRDRLSTTAARPLHNRRADEGRALAQIAREEARDRLAQRSPLHEALGLHPELWATVVEAVEAAEEATYLAAEEYVVAEHEGAKRVAAEAVRQGKTPEPITSIDDLRAVATGTAAAKLDAARAARRAYNAAVEAEPVDEVKAITDALAEAGPAAVRALTQARAALAQLEGALGLLYGTKLGEDMTVIALPREAHGATRLIDSGAIAALAGVDWAKVLRPEAPQWSYSARAMAAQAQRLTPNGYSRDGLLLAMLEQREGYRFTDYTRGSGLPVDGGMPSSPLDTPGSTGLRRAV